HTEYVLLVKNNYVDSVREARMCLIYRTLVWPYRTLHPSYHNRPLASTVVSEYIKSRKYPMWTSFFLPYRFVQDDHFGSKHFNFAVDHVNYHVLRIGCFPFIKYHFTARNVEDLKTEDLIWRAITVVNLGIPCALYGLAATFLITQTDVIVVEGKKIPIHFLIKENW
ncbi:hypothetical protein PFISCL1PPCAC_19855, partial [Pristionchus fissidentatus]